MSTPAHSGWFNHGLAFVLAAAGAWVINGRVDVHHAGLSRMPDRKSIEYPLHGYIDNYRQEPYLSSALARTFSDGSSIVLMGSSELTTADHPSKPVNFFNNELHQPLFALGHDGNQSFSMHAQLIAADVDMAHARLAILLSPSWFMNRSGREGTELASFLEYQPSPSLYRTLRRDKRGDPLSAPVAAYLAEHTTELAAAQPITKWMARDASPLDRWLYAFSQPLDAAIIRATREYMLRESLVKETTLPARRDPSPDAWRTWYEAGIHEHLAQCTTNSVFVNDAFYAEHVHGRTRTLDVWPLDENRELRDLVGLLDFLKTTHTRPYFILQPLNPYVFTNLKEAAPTIERIKQELDSRSFDYLDMWVSDTADFQPGTLTDVMHLGPLGWYRVDSAMATYFP